MLLFGMMENYGGLLSIHKLLRMTQSVENLLILFPLLITSMYDCKVYASSTERVLLFIWEEDNNILSETDLHKV